jgi:hypothetical protein
MYAKGGKEDPEFEVPNSVKLSRHSSLSMVQTYKTFGGQTSFDKKKDRKKRIFSSA